MTIVPTITPKHRKPYGFWFRTLSDFLAGPADCVELVLEEGEYSSPRVLQSTIRTAAKKYGMGISVRIVDGRVYMLKKGADLYE